MEQWCNFIDKLFSFINIDNDIWLFLELSISETAIQSPCICGKKGNLYSFFSNQQWIIFFLFLEKCIVCLYPFFTNPFMGNICLATPSEVWILYYAKSLERKRIEFYSTPGRVIDAFQDSKERYLIPQEYISFMTYNCFISFYRAFCEHWDIIYLICLLCRALCLPSWDKLGFGQGRFAEESQRLLSECFYSGKLNFIQFRNFSFVTWKLLASSIAFSPLMP